MLLGDNYTEIRVKGHNLKSGYADEESACNILNYRAMRRIVFRHAIEDEELRALAVAEAEGAPGEPQHSIEQELEEFLKIKYNGRFVLGPNLEISHRDQSITYGWSFDKRTINQHLITTDYIPTQPHV